VIKPAATNDANAMFLHVECDDTDTVA
jgi:hypothetical protein